LRFYNVFYLVYQCICVGFMCYMYRFHNIWAMDFKLLGLSGSKIQMLACIASFVKFKLYFLNILVSY
jgi:hypothetical protein